MFKLNTLRYILLAIVIMDIPFHVDKHFGYRQDLAELNALGGLSISLTTLCIAALYGLWLAESAARRSSVVNPIASTNRWLILYLAAVCVSVVVASDRTLAVFEVFLLLQTFLLYFYIVKKIRTPQEVLLVVSFLIASVFLQAMTMFGLFLVGRTVQIGPLIGRVDPGLRIGGTLGSPNGTASFLSILLALPLAVLLIDGPRWTRRLAAVAFVAGGVALVLTLSRGGWLAAAVSVSLFGVCAWLKGWLSPKIPLVVLGCAVLVMVPFHGAILDRIEGQDSATVAGRYVLIQLASRIVSDHPILGVGANNYVSVMNEYIGHPEFTGAWLHVVHNKYLLVWAENGVFAFIAFVGFLLTTVMAGWRTWKSGDQTLAPLGLACAVGVVGQMIHMNLDIFHSRPQVQLLWIVAALTTSMHAMTCRADEGTSPARSCEQVEKPAIQQGGQFA